MTEYSGSRSKPSGNDLARELPLGTTFPGNDLQEQTLLGITSRKGRSQVSKVVPGKGHSKASNVNPSESEVNPRVFPLLGHLIARIAVTQYFCIVVRFDQIGHP